MSVMKQILENPDFIADWHRQRDEEQAEILRERDYEQRDHEYDGTSLVTDDEPF